MKSRESYKKEVDKILEIYSNFSIEDIATSLFISSIWLKNIASPIKHQFMVAVFVATSPEKFSPKNQINNYQNFAQLLQSLFKCIPSFTTLEDYVPETDWGQIRFPHNGTNYKFFYGNELSNIYEYLTLFQMLYGGFDKEYENLSGRSPNNELEYCLILQQEFISKIDTQPSKENLEALSSGYIEIPPEIFWKQAMNFYFQFNAQKLVSLEFANIFSTSFGELDIHNILNWEAFGEAIFYGKLLPYYFVRSENNYYPLLPRRYSSILFDHWSSIFSKHHINVQTENAPYHIVMGKLLHQYIINRTEADILPFVTAITPEDKPHEILFPSVFISKDKLVLLHLLPPLTSPEEIERKLIEVSPKIQRAIELIEVPPITLGLFFKQQKVQIQNSKNESKLTPELVIVIPQTSTSIGSVKIPNELPGRLIFLDQLLGILDELKHITRFAEFLKYWDDLKHQISPIYSPLDILASFESSKGVLVDGAIEPTFISLYPHWGTDVRYKSLSQFWSNYPEIGYYGDPRSWEVERINETSVRLNSKSHRSWAFCSQVGTTHVFISSPFAKMSFEQGKIAFFLLECLEDTINTRKATVEKHGYFKKFNKLLILFFPLSLIHESDEFKYLRHLNCLNEIWLSDVGRPHPDYYGVRIVFNDELIQTEFEKTQNASLEVSLLLEVVNQVDRIIRDSSTQEIIEELKHTENRKPRFKLFAVDRLAAFPELIDPYKPEDYHFKKARKRIAQLALENRLSKGFYDLEEAAPILAKLKDILIAEVNTEITQFNLSQAIPEVLTRVDALNHKHEIDLLRVKKGTQHDVDYDPTEEYADHKSKYPRMHRNYRYLLEKLVQISPQGQTNLEKGRLQYLLAFIDWLYVFYEASDALYYGLQPVGIKLSDSFIPEIKYKEEQRNQEKMFSLIEANVELGKQGSKEDSANSTNIDPNFFDDIDKVFNQDLGFRFSFMLKVLHVLSMWPAYLGSQKNETPFYSATYKDIEKNCLQAIEEILPEEIEPILDFLLLKQNEVIRVIGEETDCADLPIWEHRKRFSRYNIRPLILIDKKYYWGPYSTRRSGIIWSGNVTSGTLPTDIQSRKIEKVIEGIKRQLEKEIVAKGLKAIQRYTSYFLSEKYLHRVDPGGNHPNQHQLGDFDILAFISEKNIILNIECKHHNLPFCLKDAKRYRETIFGREGKSEGDIRMIQKRHKYLSENIMKISNGLKWPISKDKLPEIISIHLSQGMLPWTMFPPKNVNIVFLTTELLSDFIKDYNRVQEAESQQ